MRRTAALVHGIRRALCVVPLLTAACSCAQMPTGPGGNAWRFLPGTVVSFRFAPFRDGRQCWVYLPPDYATSARRYPVLYLNDGEIAFDGTLGMHVNRICEDLIRRGEIEPIIVVAIENGPWPQRLIDYTPWASAYYLTPNGGGDFYVRAIRDTLKPEIDRRFRTRTGAGDTGIGGYSLGGLISAYAGYTYDGTFGKIAAFSPSYWWDGFETYAQNRGRPWGVVRYYQDTGTPDDNYIGGMLRIALQQGFVLGVNFMSLEAQGGEHGATWWEHRFPDMLRFLFAPPVGPDQAAHAEGPSHTSLAGSSTAASRRLAQQRRPS